MISDKQLIVSLNLLLTCWFDLGHSHSLTLSKEMTSPPRLHDFRITLYLVLL